MQETEIQVWDSTSGVFDWNCPAFVSMTPIHKSKDSYPIDWDLSWTPNQRHVNSREISLITLFLRDNIEVKMENKWKLLLKSYMHLRYFYWESHKRLCQQSFRRDVNNVSDWDCQVRDQNSILMMISLWIQTFHIKFTQMQTICFTPPCSSCFFTIFILF